MHSSRARVRLSAVAPCRPHRDRHLPGNGYLSLAEVDKGLHETCGLDGVHSCKPAIIRAFNAAKGLKKGAGGRDDDYVSRIEFRMLLVFLKQ